MHLIITAIESYVHFFQIISINLKTAYVLTHHNCLFTIIQLCIYSTKPPSNPSHNNSDTI